MKRTFAFIAAFVLAAGLAWAARAPETVFYYTQPDGSVIPLVNHGDEFHHWTTYNGRLMELDERGYYRLASNIAFDSQAASAQARRRQANEYRRTASKGIRFGEKHFLVFLIEFDDLYFTTPDPQRAFDRMLNQPGYSENGGTGSVRDYYMDNSSGQFRPIFDVYGPIRVSDSYRYYGKNNYARTHEALREACEILDGTIDFSNYDNDGDGEVDNIFFFFAGYNRAEGGDDNTIWPHQNYQETGIFDGVEVNCYACSSELTGNTGATMSGIGMFVHEFAHTLGVPDFYDTASDMAENPEQFSVMSDGHKLNDFRTPACFNSLELQLLGWMGEFPRLSDAGSYELESLSGHHLPWVLPADVDGEQFILEMRDGKGWDAYLPKGMVIYHMDASENLCYRTATAASLWSWIGIANSSVNCYIEHPCFYVVASKEYGRGKADSMIFPGVGNVTDFTPVPWSGHELPTRITDIRVDGDRVHFNLTADVRRRIKGSVKDMEGKPVEGATVTVSIPTRVSNPGGTVHMSRPVAAGIRYTATTGTDGSYDIPLGKGDESRSFLVSATMPGYIEQAREVQMDYANNCSFILRPAGAPSRAGLMNYDPDSREPFSSMGWGGSSLQGGIIASVYFPAEEMVSYAGMEIRSFTFCVNSDKPKAVYALVHDENLRLLLSSKVEGNSVDGYYTADLSENALRIQGDKGLYFGYAVEGVEPDPIVYQSRKGVKNCTYYSLFNLESPNWIELPDCALILSVTLYDPAASQYITLANMGFSSIDNPRWKEGYAAGDTFAFRLTAGKGKEVDSIEWLYDGTAITAPSVTLSAGKHVVAARVRYRGGSQEELTLELDVR